MTTEKDQKDLISSENKDNWDKAMTIWRGGAVYPHPDWYPSHSLIADLAWDVFARDVNGTNAMIAIEGIVRERLAIPNELIPWVMKACVAWRESDGITRELGKEDTDRKWYKAFSSIYDLRMKGYSKDDATLKIAVKADLSYDSLFATHKYKGGKVFKRVKETIHQRLMGTVMVFIDEEFEGGEHDREFTKSLISEYPAFFKKKLYMKLYPEYEEYFQDIIDLTD